MTNPGQAKGKKAMEVAQTTVAACLLGIALISLLGFVVHIAQNHSPGKRLWNGNDSLESTLGLAWFASGLLAMMMSKTLDSAARQFIFAVGGMSSALAVLFWFLAAV
jgi:hypothetical protein